MRNNVTGLEWDGLRIQQINEKRNNMAVEHNTSKRRQKFKPCLFELSWFISGEYKCYTFLVN